MKRLVSPRLRRTSRLISDAIRRHRAVGFILLLCVGSFLGLSVFFLADGAASPTVTAGESREGAEAQSTLHVHHGDPTNTVKDNKSSTSEHRVAPKPLAEAFDYVYVVTVKGCENRADIVKDLAVAAGLRPHIFFGKHFQDIDLRNPPIPILGIPPGSQVAAGQVGCTTTHNMIWQDVIDHNYARVLVLEDDVFVTNDTLAILPQIMENIDRASEEKRLPWHYLYLRRTALRNTKEEEVWATSPSGHPITRAVPSWGTASYALSAAGARYLREKVSFYQYPLDVQISKAQMADAGFVALSACFHDAFRHNCPENIFELTAEQKGKCAFSGTQAGQRLDASEFPTTV